MFELILQAASIVQSGEYMNVSDVSDWDGVGMPARADFGVFINGTFQLTEDLDDVTILDYDSLTVTYWTATTPQIGRYNFTAYAFPVLGTNALVDGLLEVHPDGKLYQYDLGTTTWNEVDFLDHIAEATYTSEVLKVPYLAQAYGHRNLMNLTYIRAVKRDIDNGAEQNKLYYKRTDLDYFYALILSAEYNWALGLYANYYQICRNMQQIMDTNIIS